MVCTNSTWSDSRFTNVEAQAGFAQDVFESGFFAGLPEIGGLG
jgi:hypothetical protein